VPLAPDVASRAGASSASADCDRRRRPRVPGDAGRTTSTARAAAPLQGALARAGLRPLRFHDLRHTFGTRMIAKADIRRVQEWMGHADIQTTMKYLHYAPRGDDAALVAEAFDRDGAITLTWPPVRLEADQLDGALVAA
jgi:integrase